MLSSIKLLSAWLLPREQAVRDNWTRLSTKSCISHNGETLPLPMGLDSRPLDYETGDLTIELHLNRELHILKKIQKNTNNIFSECLLRLCVLRVLCCSLCLFVYRPYCHGALKLDMSTLFTTFVLWTSIQFIL